MADDTNIELKLKDVRLAFFYGFRPKKNVSKETGRESWSYECAILLDKVKDKEQIAAIRDALKKAKLAKWGDKAPVIGADRLCLSDGEPIDPETIELDHNDQPKPGSGTRVPRYDGYAGTMVLSAKRSIKATTQAEADATPNPLNLIGPRKGPDGKFKQLTEAEGLLYSGCYANLIVRIYGFDGSKNGYPNRINCSLEAVQHKRHGTAFSGQSRVDVDSAFDEEDAEDGFDGNKGAAADEDLGV